MQSYVRRGLAVALTALGLAACTTESLAPTKPRATSSSPALSIGVVAGTVICMPCPPGLVCAAVCNSSPPIEVAPPTAGDTAADATIVPGTGPALRTPPSSSDTAFR